MFCMKTKIIFDSSVLKKMMDERNFGTISLSRSLHIEGKTVTPQSVRNWLRGEMPTTQAVFALSGFFGVPMESFVKYYIPKKNGM